MKDIAGCGMEGGGIGYAFTSSFYQPCGICVEGDENIYVTDSQQGSVKLNITKLRGSVSYLKLINKLKRGKGNQKFLY